MIEPKQDGEKNSKRQCEKNLSDLNIPELHKPGAIRRGEEGAACRQLFQLDGLHAPEMHEPRKEDDCERRAVVLEEDAYGVPE